MCAVDKYRDAYGVEPICRLLQIAPSGYRRRVQQRARPWLRCKRSQADEKNCGHIQRVWHANWQVYGVVKVWRQMQREGLSIARCTVQRLMRRLGLEGARRGKKIRTTQPDTARPCPLDLVNRQFNAERPNQLWVADFTYVASWQGQMFVAFVIDVYARRIVGWRVSSHMRTDFVVDALEQALYARQPQQEALLIHHSDRGAQYVSLRYTERLAEAGLMPSVGSTGDSYDNALAETINGLYKTEVIYKRGPWKTRESLELATLQWVHWFNHDRLLEPIGHIPPAEAEANYWRQVFNQLAPTKPGVIHNAACEGFFGRLKMELFYPSNWQSTTIEQFIEAVDTYIRWYNEKRIKVSLGRLSPVEYRHKLGLAA